MRLFVAAYPPAQVCDDLERRLADLEVAAAAARGVNTRLARRDTWHLTLVFLGEVADERAPDAVTAVGRAVDRWRAAGSGAPELRLAGGGRFGRGRFTVLWVGVDGEREALARLARQVRRELKRDRLPYDDRPFTPHLTVARPGDRVDRAAVEADRAVLAGYRGPAWRVDTVALVRSHPGPKPWYAPIAGWPVTPGHPAGCPSGPTSGTG
jgi:RNA 2',3'-cyclic 3'-phosphodiesterase